jgi:hypothetical protein
VLLNLPIPKPNSPTMAESSSYPSLYSTSSYSPPNRIASAANSSRMLTCCSVMSSSVLDFRALCMNDFERPRSPPGRPDLEHVLDGIWASCSLLTSRPRVRPTATHCRCTFADTSKASFGGPNPQCSSSPRSQVPCTRRHSRTGCGTECRVGYTVRRSASRRSGAVARPCAATPVRESVFRCYSG